MAVLSMLTHNFDSGTPFIYLNGNEDTSLVSLLHNEAIARGKLDSLYIINAFTKDAGNTNTLDPINPLVGYEAGFEAIFGVEFGRVLNQLCLCKHQSGHLVDFETLASFLPLSNLVEISADAKYTSAKSVLDLYLDQLPGEADASALRHAALTEKARNFIRLLSDMPMCSFAPDIDFESVYVHKKFLYVMLPIHERSRDEREIVGALMLALAAKYRPDSTHDCACPSVIIDSVIDRHIYTVDLISDFAGSNTVFSYWIEVLEDEVGYDVFEAVTRTCASFLVMKCESFWSPCLMAKVDVLKTSDSFRINIRDVVGQQAGSCIGFGHIIKTRKSVDSLVTNPAHFQMTYHDLTKGSEAFNFNRVKLSRPLPA
jgi:hypothetical protein